MTSDTRYRCGVGLGGGPTCTYNSYFPTAAISVVLSNVMKVKTDEKRLGVSFYKKYFLKQTSVMYKYICNRL